MDLAAVVGQNCWLGAQWGTGDPPKMSSKCHPIGGETLVTDGRVDDRLVWWSWHSLECTKSSVRVPPETPIEARQNRSGGDGKCPVGDHLTESDLWAAMLDGDVTHGLSPWLMAMVDDHGWMEDDGIYTTSLTCTNTPHSRVPRN